LLLYLPVRNYAFINYDDGIFVYQNPHVQGGLTADGIRWAFTSHDIDYWRPLSWLSHMLDVALYGMNAGGHHFTSAVIHAANVVMLFLLGLAIWSRHWPAFLVAAIFAGHPVHVESVAWVAERKDVLCGFFWLAAVWSYVRFRDESGRRFRWLTPLCFLLGIMSKPMIVTLPFQLMLLDLWPLKRIDATDRRVALRQLWISAREKWPLFLITFGVCVWTYLAQQEAKAMAATAHIGLTDRLGNVLVSYARYLGNILWPHDLAVFYPLVPRWPVITVTGAVGLFVLLSGFATWQLRRRPFLFTGWFWFVGTLVPVIGIIHVGGQSMADRYAYIPAIGLYLALVHVVLPRSRPSAWPNVVLLSAAVLLGWKAHRQIRTWEDGITVFTQAVNVTKDNWLAMNNLANNHAAVGNWSAAHPLFEAVARLNSGTAESHYNVALARGELGLLTAAEAGYRKALELDPEHFNALKNLANLLTDRFGRHAEAIELYRRALAIRPDDQEVRQYLADTLILEQRLPEAETELRAILQAHPANEDAAITLAQMLVHAGRIEAAGDLLRQVADEVTARSGDATGIRAMADSLAK
jgi:tetratricopeptide (TPR) repeat protein